jgi:hypothetical protein
MYSTRAVSAARGSPMKATSAMIRIRKNNSCLKALEFSGSD